MQNITFQILPVSTEMDFSAVDEKLKNNTMVYTSGEDSSMKRWKKVNTFTQPGMKTISKNAQQSVKPVFAFLVTISVQTQKTYDDAAGARGLYEAFSVPYDKDIDNVLSASYTRTETDHIYHIFYYPIDGRVVNAEKWLKKGQLLDDYQRLAARTLLKVAPGAITMSASISEKAPLLSGYVRRTSDEKDYVELFYDTVEKNTVQTDVPFGKILEIYANTKNYFQRSEIHLYRMAQSGSRTQQESKKPGICSAFLFLGYPL